MNGISSSLDLSSILSGQDLANALSAARAWVSSNSQSYLGVAFPFSALVALPFAIPLVWSLFKGGWVMVACVCLIAWLGASSLAGPAVANIDGLRFAMGFGVCMLLVGCEKRDRLRRRALAAALSKAEVDGASLQIHLDRERFWRRANGSVQEGIADDDLNRLIDRIKSHQSSSGSGKQRIDEPQDRSA